MLEHKDVAVMNYAIKILSKKKFTPSALDYYIKTVLHLAFIHPYLIQLIQNYIFVPFNVDKSIIQEYTQSIYNESIKCKNFEASCYAVYFSIIYGFDISCINVQDSLSSQNCILLLISFIYYSKRGDKKSLQDFKNHAKSLQSKDEDFGRYWLFIYEVLPKSSLKSEWRNMKENGVSFIKI